MEIENINKKLPLSYHFNTTTDNILCLFLQFSILSCLFYVVLILVCL